MLPRDITWVICLCVKRQLDYLAGYQISFWHDAPFHKANVPALIEWMFSTGCGVNHWRTESSATITIGNVMTTLTFLYSKIKTKFIQGLNYHRPVYGAQQFKLFRTKCRCLSKHTIREDQILNVVNSAKPISAMNTYINPIAFASARYRKSLNIYCNLKIHKNRVHI